MNTSSGSGGRVTTSILVDSNVFLDIFWGGSPVDWSREKLAILGGERQLAINPIIWSEVGARFATAADLDRAMAGLAIERRPLPYNAAFRAGQAHLAYRRQGGQRERTLPDFLIGAHAEVENCAILTRDPARYRSYFPMLEIISPETHP